MNNDYTITIRYERDEDKYSQYIPASFLRNTTQAQSSSYSKFIQYDSIVNNKLRRNLFNSLKGDYGFQGELRPTTPISNKITPIYAGLTNYSVQGMSENYQMVDYILNMSSAYNSTTFVGSTSERIKEENEANAPTRLLKGGLIGREIKAIGNTALNAYSLYTDDATLSNHVNNVNTTVSRGVSIAANYVAFGAVGGTVINLLDSAISLFSNYITLINQRNRTQAQSEANMERIGRLVSDRR